MRRVINMFRWGTVGVILLTFVAYLAPYVNPEAFWPISFFGMAYPWLLLANVLVLVGWLVLRKRYFLLPLGCILMGWSHLTGFIGLSWSGGTEQGVSVMTYNIQYLSYAWADKGANKSAREKQFIQFLKGNRPDVLCLQECNKYSLELIAKQLGYRNIHRVDTKGTAILSDFPLKDKGHVEFGTRTNSCLWADVLIDGKSLRVYSIHLQSNRVSTQADKVLNEGNIQEKETWKTIGGMISNVKEAGKRRARQALQVARHVAVSKKPVVVCGDFNDTPQSYTYRLISKHLQDAFRKKGAGLGTTYAGDIPALRIDYILADERLDILDCDLINVPFSDHYPVRSHIKWKQ
ncbi:MAG: endonuclease/exonuclease/phosphatase family protein [Bacteroidota bacterium]